MTATKERFASFTELPAVRKLEKLAQNPFDLTKEGNLTPKRIEDMVAHGAGYTLLYGTEKVTPEVMQALLQLAEEAQLISKMEGLQSGEVLNKIEGYPSDNRAVLHTAMRDLFDHPQTAPLAREATGLEKKEHEKLKKFLAENEKKFNHLIAIGIGGSDLGPKALYLALSHLQKKDRSVNFISNIDPDAPAEALRNVDLSRTLIVVVSKSGSTMETATNEAIIREALAKAGLRPEQHIVSITAQGSPMDDKSKYLECFYSWDFVGGRFCCTAMMGAVTLSFAFGHDVFWEILRGAHDADRMALDKEITRNIPLLMALLGVWNRNFLRYPTVAIVPYSQALWRFAAHIQQVDMESNGKRIDRFGDSVSFETGPIVWGEPGTAAQHSFYQLIHQGTDIIPLELIGFKENQSGESWGLVNGTTSQEKLLSNMIAQAIALAIGHDSDNPNKVFPGNRPSHMLVGKKLTPYALGALFAIYEHKIAFQGFVWNINSFDQEGVQLGKVLADKMLHQYANRRSGKKGEGFPLGDAFARHIDQLK